MTAVPTVHDRWLRTARRLSDVRRWLVALLALIPLLLIALILGALLWASASTSVGEAEGTDLPPSVRDRIRDSLEAPTAAERARMRQLAFVGRPFPTLPPIQIAFIPLERTFGGAPYEERQNFRRFRERFIASGCPRGTVVDPAAREAASEALRQMDQRLTGFSQLRLRYHQALVELCHAISASAQGDEPAAQDRYNTARGHFDVVVQELDRLDRSERWVRQYRAVNQVGLVLTSRLLARSATELSAVAAPDMTAFAGSLCTGTGPDCDLFDRRESALTGATLSALLAGARHGEATDRNAYRSLSQQFSNIALSSPNLTANLAVAAALYGDQRLIGQLRDDARAAIDAGGDNAARWRDSPALARLINIAWMNGRIPASWRPPASYFSATPNALPVELGLDAADIELMRPWNELSADREDLESGQSDSFARFTRRRSTVGGQSPETRLFLAEARNEFAARIAPVLTSAARDLGAAPGGDRQSHALLTLLKTDMFPLETRLDALLLDSWLDLSLTWALTYLIIFYLVAGLVYLTLLNLAIGYVRAFPRRHYDDGLKPPSAAAIR